MNYGYYYASWNEADDDEIRDFLVKLTGRSDIRKYDCKRSSLFPDDIIMRHKQIHPSHYEITKKHFGERFEYHKEEDVFPNEKTKELFYSNFTHRQDLALHVEKGFPLERLDATQEMLQEYLAEKGEA